ncbi:DUF2795 domain-containing protein [Microbacterium suwonense]|uniref:DUF2795 domain-containing protein n=1 Tax=Microbacterium suwonense TaxID=683047 RepID=A0ABN6X8C4_9MICO|nr:DUF2795 domain-containing protein [Microbacterium suwonense]BDZ40455.1 hypothetical protein GCM10025863_30690 [Microbacterium suwonense]
MIAERSGAAAITPMLNAFLLGMEYPATDDDLLREARRDGLGADELAMIGSLPPLTYDSAWEVERNLLAHTTSEREPAMIAA